MAWGTMERTLAVVLTGIMVLSVVAVSAGGAYTDSSGEDAVSQSNSGSTPQVNYYPTKSSESQDSVGPPTVSNVTNHSAQGGAPDTTLSDQNLELTKGTTTSTTTQVESRVFTLSDILYFGYDNDTTISGPTEEFTLNDGEHHLSQVSRGFYTISSTKKFAFISGDPVTRSVNGYFARDDNEQGVSKYLNTYVTSSSFAGEAFIVFAYNDGTEVTVKRSDTGEVVWSGTLDKGEHHAIPSSQVTSTALTVTSDDPVSALSYFDQGYYTPAANGKFVGETFYTFVGTITDGTNDLVVTAYEDSTTVTIKNSKTGDVILSGSIDAGETITRTFDSDTYITVKSRGDVSVSVQPFQSWKVNDYHHTLYVPGESGSLIDTEFYEATTGGDYAYVFAYRNNTNVTVTDPQTGTVQDTYSLQEGDVVDVNPGTGVWKISATKSISVQSGYGEFSAAFGPLEFGEAQVGVTDYTVSPNNPAVDESVTVNATISNTGTQSGTLDVLFYTDGTVAETRTVNLAPGEITFERFTTSFSETGLHTVTVNSQDRTDIYVGPTTVVNSKAEGGSARVTQDTWKGSAANMIDGDPTTKWQVRGTPSEIIAIFNLSGPAKVIGDYIDISGTGGGRDITAYQLFTRNSSSENWTLAKQVKGSVTDDGDDTAEHTFSEAIVASQFKLVITEHTAPSGCIGACDVPIAEYELRGDFVETGSEPMGADPDGDGKHEDVNGDGVVDIGDVSAMFANLHAPSIANHPEAFDFNDDTGVDVADVQALYQELVGGGSPSGSAGATDITISPDSATVPPGETTSVDLIVSNANGGVGAFQSTVSLPSASVVEITDVSVAGDASETNVSIDDAGSTASIEAALMDTDDSGAVTVATVTLTGVGAGSTTLSMSMDSAGNETGHSYDVIGSAETKITGESGGNKVKVKPTSRTVRPTGQTVGYEVILTNVNGGVGAFDNVTLNVNNTNVATFNTISTDVSGSANSGVISAGSTAFVNVPFGGDTNDTGDVTLATFTMTANTNGVAAIDVTVTGDISKENGKLYDISAVEDGSLTVSASAGPPAVVGEDPPSNTDADSQLEDVNGNKRLDIGDVQALFANRNSDAVQNNVDSFDFNDNQRIDIGDIQALFDEFQNS